MFFSFYIPQVRGRWWSSVVEGVGSKSELHVLQKLIEIQFLHQRNILICIGLVIFVLWSSVIPSHVAFGLISSIITDEYSTAHGDWPVLD